MDGQHDDRVSRLDLSPRGAASVYGAAESFVIMLWIQYAAQVFFFGAEFTKVYSRHFGAIVVPDPTARRSE